MSIKEVKKKKKIHVNQRSQQTLVIGDQAIYFKKYMQKITSLFSLWQFQSLLIQGPILLGDVCICNGEYV
jgi:hypothetical protein